MVETVQTKREFSPLETVFAWGCLLMGYAFCRVFPVTENPLGGFLFILAAFAVVLIVLLKKGVRPGVLPLLAAGSAVAVSASLVLCANALIHAVAFLYAMGMFAYLVYAAAGNALEPGASDLLPADFFRALVILPFASFGELFSAAFSGRARGLGKTLVKVLIGVAAAVIPTAVVWGLLSYDNAFNSLIDTLFSFSFDTIVSHLFSLILAVPVGMYIFGLFVSSVDRRCADTLTADECRELGRQVRFVPAVTAAVAVLPLLVMYVIFFVSQWQYYISGFIGQLPENFSYADYAREGFFQLCAVSVINLLVLAAIAVFLRRRTDRPPVLLRVLSLIFSVFTLVLIATAIAKMMMYIDFYGLTPKRVYATWFMLMLTAVFLLIVVKQFAARFKLIFTTVAVCVVFFAGLALSGVDGIIAAYNVDRYLDGTLEEVDFDAMEELGDAAIPELVRLAETLDAQNGTDIASFSEADLKDDDLYSHLAAQLYLMASDRLVPAPTVFGFTAPQARATAALERAGIDPELTEERTMIYANYRLGYTVEESIVGAQKYLDSEFDY